MYVLLCVCVCGKSPLVIKYESKVKRKKKKNPTHTTSLTAAVITSTHGEHKQFLHASPEPYS